MKTINFRIRVEETVDGYRLDLDDYSTGESIKLNPTTKEELFTILLRNIDLIQNTESL